MLGIPLAIEKVEGPATVLEFLGIVLDTERMEARLQDGEDPHHHTGMVKQKECHKKGNPLYSRCFTQQR